MSTQDQAQGKPQEDRAEFAQVLEEELDLLSGLRGDYWAGPADTAYWRARAMNLAGLAFSGGGIRSATFNLGVIQALARFGLLSRFDYLSTVSGGGYIGGWLSALLHRKAAGQDKRVDQQDVECFQCCLKTHPEPEPRCGDLPETVGFAPVEHLAVRYLRRYSNYLSPRLGLSGDVLAAVSIFLRNFTLIQLALISLVASFLLLAHVVAVASKTFSLGVAGHYGIDAFLNPAWPFAASALLLVFSVVMAGRLVAERGAQPDKPARAGRAVHYRVVLPGLLAVWWLSAAAVGRPQAMLLGNGGVAAFFWALFGGLGYAGAWYLGYVALQSRRRYLDAGDGDAGEDQAPHPIMRLGLAAVASGAVLGLMLFAAACRVKEISSAAPMDLWHAVAYGPPLLLLGLSFVVTVHIGAARRAFSENQREWFARLGGFVLYTAAAWALVFTLVLYATPFVHWLAGGGSAALAAWIGASGIGAWLARGPATSGMPGGSKWKEAAARIAPWLFVIGLAVIVADATHILLLKFLTESGYIPSPTSDFGIAAASALQQLHELPLAGTFAALVLVCALFVLIAWRLDINLFSLHAMYCNRLARAYLGASRAGARRPNPYTGFDAEDDLHFSDLVRQRPIPIINTAINMTGGDDLAWQTRRAASFAFTPCWAGYETRSTQGTKLGCYRPTRLYAANRKLGTLMAVSGAAASPNMGYHTSAAVAALMTAFNLRLGRWCGNPELDDGTWKQASPGFAAQPILAELTGSATARADWINLTDGGHFENLGVYELIRRRCRLILVTDAGCDPRHHFEDLANLVRKCWTDLGVNIRFDEFEPMHLKEHSRYCGAHGAVGRIQYYDGGPDGAIIYLKSSMTGDEWPDIRQYADAHPDFPHETTTDQFFDENQFEAYRHLGYKVVAKMVGTLQAVLGGDPKNIPTDELVSRLVP